MVERDKSIAALPDAAQRGVQGVSIETVRVDEKGMRDLPAEQLAAHGFKSVERFVQMGKVGRPDEGRPGMVPSLERVVVNGAEKIIVMLDGERHHRISMALHEAFELPLGLGVRPGLVERVPGSIGAGCRA